MYKNNMTQLYNEAVIAVVSDRHKVQSFFTHVCEN